MQQQHLELFCRKLIEAFPDAVCCFHPEGGVLTANHKFAELVLAPDPDSLIGSNVYDLLVSEQQQKRSEIMDRLAHLNTSKKIRMDLLRRDGRVVPIEINPACVEDVPGQQPVILTVIRNITEKKHSEEAARLAEQVFQHSSDGIFITDENNRILRVNSAFTEVTGYAESEVKGRNPRIFSSGRQGKEFYEKMWKAIKARGAWQGEIINRRKNGELYHQWLSVSAMRNDNGIIHRHIAIISDITEHKAAEAHVRWLAHHDTLTGLSNRNVLEDRVRYAVQRAKRDGDLAAVLMLDLDHFKPINDNHGHAYGDQLLIELTARLSDCVRATDTLARIGGDEFAVLLPDIRKPDHAGVVAEKIIRSVRRPFEINGTSMEVGVSIGISMIPEHGVDTVTLLSCADKAMYHTKKQQQSNSYAFYSADISN